MVMAMAKVMEITNTTKSKVCNLPLLDECQFDLVFILRKWEAAYRK